MIVENKNKYKISIPFQYFNENQYLKPQGYQNIINILSEVHLSDTDQQIGALIEGKYSWVILSLTVEIKVPINKLKPVYGKTWYSGKRGPYFRREYQIEDEDDNVLFVGASYTILMNMENRTIYRKPTLPFKTFNMTSLLLLDAKTNFKIDRPNNLILQGVVLNSDIDGLGHVNNLKYTEFIYNSFNNLQIKALKQPFKIALYFQKELIKNEKYLIYSNENEVFQIYNKTKDQNSFTFVFKQL